MLLGGCVRGGRISLRHCVTVSLSEMSGPDASRGARWRTGTAPFPVCLKWPKGRFGLETVTVPDYYRSNGQQSTQHEPGAHHHEGRGQHIAQ
jgi:hypothetical protein